VTSGGSARRRVLLLLLACKWTVQKFVVLNKKNKTFNRVRIISFKIRKGGGAARAPRAVRPVDRMVERRLRRSDRAAYRLDCAGMGRKERGAPQRLPRPLRSGRLNYRDLPPSYVVANYLIELR
jgi:hypothetical protein